MVDIVNLYKNKGETPLEALNRLQKLHPEFNDVPLSYAGRLDPMAEGVMLVLAGDANKKREEYLGLEKEYIVDVLFGVETDTYDVLGKIVGGFNQKLNREGIFKNRVGTFHQPYPPYSSKPVNGKPLFQWAREGKLDEIEIPTKEVTIYSCDVLKEYTITKSELKERIKKDIGMMKGDFRQDEILLSWTTFLNMVPQDFEFRCARLKVHCSSGTYMRSLSHRLGGVALSIIRTKVGNYTLEESIR